MCSMHNRINKLAYCLQQLASAVGVGAVSKWNEHCNIAYFHKTETINYRMHLHRTVLGTYVHRFMFTYISLRCIYILSLSTLNGFCRCEWVTKREKWHRCFMHVTLCRFCFFIRFYLIWVVFIFNYSIKCRQKLHSSACTK